MGSAEDERFRMMQNLIDFINKNYIEGIINDTSYNHFDMLTYFIILFAGVYAVLKLLNRLKIEINETFVIATIPYIIMGSVFRVIEDADILNPPVKYFFITPLIYFVIFAICFSILLLTLYLERTGRIKSYIHMYAGAGIILSLAGVIILIYNSDIGFPEPDILLYILLPALALTEFIKRISPAIGMFYLRSRVYSFVIFSFLLDSLTTYIGTVQGYTNKHPFSSFLASIFGTGIILVPLSLILVVLIIMMLERESRGDKTMDEKYMLILTLIVLGLSMGARNLLVIAFGI
ncbi:putative membrane protein [Candidatus Methanoperedens nitroreducens]|uniref:Putative membrane protein n=1 Tax=Candidatus Methanoperedens nitratireducens TaxID=1392998 RepID=A0A062V9I0_9EURY|nr:DUF63 family protein [Candidatus Methanoperedens nitroreducens]KCZ72409.1 putative membrane protein [Candidatus Methanoperedens nitroreducens]MDJ1423657.1 DUF63 family protein [Candidatus Methanoperedens sp.]